MYNLRTCLQRQRLPAASTTSHNLADPSASEEGQDDGWLVSSPFSSVCGFSDYGSDNEDRCGRGYKVNISGLPENCSKDMLSQMLSDFEVRLEEINFIGVRSQQAAVFANSHDSADQLVTACHLRVARGCIIRCRLSRAEDLDSTSSLSNDVAPGDLVKIQGLMSDTGVKLNGLYGKVVSVDDVTGRFALKMRSQVKTLGLKPDNIKLAMKAEEISDSDENLFLDLKA